MTQGALRWGVAGALLVSMAGCLEPATGSSAGGAAGPGTGSGGGYHGGDQANGGIGGSGSGTTSGYGSIIINGIRKFDIDNATLILDGEPLGFSGDDRLPIGVTVEYLLDEDVDENLSSGTALEVRAMHQVIGPVTSGNGLLDTLLDFGTLEVMGQPVQFSDSDTHLVAAGALVVNSLRALDLQHGDIVAVSGYPDGDGTLHATRIAVAGDASQWQLIGRSRDFAAVLDPAVQATSFTINNQTISLGGVVPECPEGASASQKVHVTASRDSEFLNRSGHPLQTVTSVKCVPDGLSVLQDMEDIPADLPVAYSGIVESSNPVTGETILLIDGQRVAVTSETSLLRVLDGLISVATDLLAGDLVGKRIDVDGHLREDGVIEADHVIVLSPLAELLDIVVCDMALWWLPGCGDPLVYTESPLDGMTGESAMPSSSPAISVLGLEPRFEVQLGEVAPANDFSRRVFAALDRSVSETKPEQPVPPAWLVASVQ